MNFKYKWKWRNILDVFLVFIILAWSVFLFIKSPSEVIEIIGEGSGYLVLFVNSFLGGLASISAAFVYPPLIALTMGGLHPIFAGIIAGFALSLSNFLFFYIGMRSHDIVSESNNKFSKTSKRFISWINKGPDYLVPIIVFIYVGLTPLPNNILMVSGGLFDLKFRSLILPLILGNIFALSLISYLSLIGYNYLT